MQTATPQREALQIEPDNAALRWAWQAYRLESWPATFEETMLDNVRARLVRMHAVHMANPSNANKEPSKACARSLPAPRVLPAGFVDHKRAAAGDNDD